ncbi:MAG: alpha/beta hydrolase [Methylocystis sp.]|nr:alpha/beta hydrolase [Methylocystis sp.]MBI3276015.1 alpha/beta hydrolase [Methylocystis sp.]
MEADELEVDFIEVEKSDGCAAWRIARRFRKARGEGVERPGIVWLGGLKSDMSGAKATFLDNWARGAGRALLRFDYSGHGESDGRFEDGAIGDWLEQSLAMFEASTKGPQILVGASMGGWIALLLARRLAEKGQTHRLHALALIAPAVDFTEELMWKGFNQHIRRRIMEEGAWSWPSAYALEPTPITRRLIEEGRNHLLLRGVIRTHAPVHILQGMVDPDVPWRHALTLTARLAADPATLSLVADGDHRLSRQQDLVQLVTLIEALG